MKKLNITITGHLGSGKSSIAKELCNVLNYKYFSTGNIQREIGGKNGMDTLELNYFSEKNSDIDKYIDDQLIKINEQSRTLGTYIIDSRMAWHFIKESFKVYLTVNPMLAAQRVISDKQRENEPVLNDISAKALNLIERRTAENRRFNSKYGVDCSNMNNYDIVIDTTKSTVQEISILINQLYLKYLNKESINKYWVSPMILYPTEHVRQLDHNEAKEIGTSIPHVRDTFGYDINSIVETVKLGADLYIWDGHKRVSEAIFNKISLIPVLIIAMDNEEIHPGNKVSEFIETTFNLSRLYDWEDMHGFLFDTYPEIKQDL